MHGHELGHLKHIDNILAAKNLLERRVRVDVALVGRVL